MKKIVLLLLVLSLTSPIFSQELKKCATTEYMEQLISENPGVFRSLQDIENRIQNYIVNNKNRSQQTVIVIPVVVHVIWNTAAQNITEAMVKSQIRILNEDYRKMAGTNGWNTNPVGADVRIEFRLADRDPNGLPHSGINRVNTSYTSFNYQTQNALLKGLSYWPSDKYLNLWTANLSGGVLGYAQFPGGPPTTDGVVILWSAFGHQSPISLYNYGRTATHEVGHWLNLIHIWGDVSTCTGTDYCEDTPQCFSDYYSNPSSCPIPTQCGFPRMIQNYMDYSGDLCMNIFTQDQTSRMRAAYSVYRYGLMASQKEVVNVTQTGVDYNLTDHFGQNIAALNFSALGNVDTVTVEVFPNMVPLNIPPGSKAVRRYFKITANGTGFNANMKLYYKDSEVVNFINGESSLFLYKEDNGGWFYAGGTVNSTENYIQLPNVTSFSSWAISDPTDNPIPVELASFNSEVTGNSVTLSWMTATETNTRGFAVERAISSDYRDITWKEISFVPASGTSTEIRRYSFTDESVIPGSYLYRLRIIDNDGSYSYSDVINTEVKRPVTYSLEQNYPNPFNPSTTIAFTIPEQAFVTIKIYNTLGKEVALLLNADTEPGTHEINFDASKLTSGVYYYSIFTEHFSSTNKMMLLK
jgi:hypothetical protein